MMIFAIDPGTTESGFVVFSDSQEPIIHAGVCANEHLLDMLRPDNFAADFLAIEMVASYGMPVGKEVFETVRWIGRFEQRWRDESKRCMQGGHVQLVYRKDVKQHLCGTLKAKDANIRQALIDKLGPQGTKKAPGPTYGIKSHAWAALAVAVTAAKR